MLSTCFFLFDVSPFFNGRISIFTMIHSYILKQKRGLKQEHPGRRIFRYDFFKLHRKYVCGFDISGAPRLQQFCLRMAPAKAGCFFV